MILNNKRGMSNIVSHSKNSMKFNSEYHKIYWALWSDKKRFGGKRKQVLERDNNSCKKCGISNRRHLVIFKCELTIHHKDGKGRNSKKPNNRMSNLETLCIKCHRKNHSIKKQEVKNGK
jgi:5-methylcytosine-specific restriction endonuclease McrA